jgi:hypothetical protein
MQRITPLAPFAAVLLALTLGCASGEDETSGAGPTSSSSSSGSGASSAGGAGAGGSGSGGSSVGGSGG